MAGPVLSHAWDHVRSGGRPDIAQDLEDGEKRMKKWLVIAIASVVVVGTLAFAGYRIYLNEAHDNAMMLVPPNALLYVNAFLNPSTHQKQALRDLLEKFPAAGDPEDTQGTLEKYLDDALASSGVTFSHDIEPWLDREVAIAVLPPLPPADSDAAPNVVGYIGTTDADQSMAFVERLNAHEDVATDPESYRGIDYELTEDDDAAFGVLDDFLLVASSEESFRKAVDASEGDSLATSTAFKEAIAPLPDDRIVLSYASLPGLFGALKASGEISADVEETVPQIRDLSPVAASASLRPDGVVFDLAYRSERPDGAADDGVLAMVPRASWGAIGVHDLGATVKQRLELLSGRFGVLGSAAIAGKIKSFTGLGLQDEILSWMDDGAVFFEGKKELRGGAVVGSTDGRKSAAAVLTFGRSLDAAGTAVGIGDHDENHARIAFTRPDPPTLVQLIAVPDSVWLALGETSNEIGSTSIDDSPTYRAAKEAMGEFSMIGYADVDGARTFGENLFVKENGPLPAVYTTKVAPNVDPVSFVGLGARTAGGVTSYRLMIGVE